MSRATDFSMKRWKPVLAAVVEVFGEAQSPILRAAVSCCMGKDGAAENFLELVERLATRDQDRLLQAMKKHSAKARPQPRQNGLEYGPGSPF